MGPVNICLAIIRWLPVIFITAVVVWSYYAYVIQMCILTITNIPQKVLYLILYHPFIIMFFWSYWKAIFTEVGSVPKEFFLSVSDVEQFERSQNEENQKEILSRFARNLPVQCRTNSGAYRYCEKCKCIKPDRAHHCSVCGQCILKMDHHCPWVNNCVSFTTYKYFVLFLGYSLLYCLYVAATSLQYFILFWTGMGGDSHDLSNLHIVFVFFVAVMFAISLLTLFGYHLFLTSKNRSTLESFRAPIFASGPDKDGFSLGRKGNFMEVFGDNSKLWFLPMYSSTGDGVTYPTRVLPSPSSYHSMDTTTTATTTATNPATQPSKSVERENTNNSSNFGDGVNFPVRTIDEDYDSLLGQRQRWMEEGDMDNGGPEYTHASFTPKNNPLFINSEEE